ncbi:hypothetical protein Bbelb_008510 [Branchiostoma belcheri]|nr:hypothetical protein Bbelb_008510 [Branchiostoma belcheri]
MSTSAERAVRSADVLIFVCFRRPKGDPIRGRAGTEGDAEYTLTKRRRDLIVRTPRGTPPNAGIPPGHISYVTDQMNRIKPMPARLLNPAGASRGYIPDGHRRNWDLSLTPCQSLQQDDICASSIPCRARECREMSLKVTLWSVLPRVISGMKVTLPRVISGNIHMSASPDSVVAIDIRERAKTTEHGTQAADAKSWSFGSLGAILQSYMYHRLRIVGLPWTTQA